jgi:immunity protein 35 of polymorphic toxin system
VAYSEGESTQRVMIDRTEATRLALTWLKGKGHETDAIDLCLLEEQTLETEFGWVFFYTSKLFHETGDFKYAVAGNAPMIVDRTLGSLHLTGTARSIEYYIEEFRRQRALIGLSTATFIGQPCDDDSILTKLPRNYLEFLRSVNGCVVFGGGLHIRGVANEPDWHSMRRVWIEDDRLSALYPQVHADDVPFAQDCLGDQFLLRSNSVYRLSGETGEIENLELGWQDFFSAATANPIEFLSLQPLQRFKLDGNSLEPGQLLNVYPPFCTKESANGVSMKAVPALEQIRFLADFSDQIATVANGTKIRMSVK